jgi:hypothetical protein
MFHYSTPWGTTKKKRGAFSVYLNRPLFRFCLKYDVIFVDGLPEVYRRPEAEVVNNLALYEAFRVEMELRK